jgi:hypothetical protein
MERSALEVVGFQPKNAPTGRPIGARLQCFNPLYGIKGEPLGFGLR